MPPLRGEPSLSQPSLSPPPPRLTGERGLKDLFGKLSPSSPVGKGGRRGEEGRGDEGQRTGNANLAGEDSDPLDRLVDLPPAHVPVGDEAHLFLVHRHAEHPN